MQDHWRRTLAARDPANRADLRAKHVKKVGTEAQLALATVGGIPLGWDCEFIADTLGAP